MLALVQAAASNGAVSPQDESRPWDVYVLAAVAGGDRRIAGGFVNPFDMTSTADGSNVLVAGVYDGTAGIWLIDVKTGAISSAALGKFFGISLSTDGTAIVAAEEGNAPNLIRRLPIS